MTRQTQSRLCIGRCHYEIHSGNTDHLIVSRLMDILSTMRLNKPTRKKRKKYVKSHWEWNSCMRSWRCIADIIDPYIDTALSDTNLSTITESNHLVYLIVGRRMSSLHTSTVDITLQHRHLLTCQCRKPDGTWCSSTLDLNDCLGNNNGLYSSIYCVCPISAVEESNWESIKVNSSGDVHLSRSRHRRSIFPSKGTREYPSCMRSWTIAMGVSSRHLSIWWSGFGMRMGSWVIWSISCTIN